MFVQKQLKALSWKMLALTHIKIYKNPSEYERGSIFTFTVKYHHTIHDLK